MSWSPCSRDELDELIEDGLSGCDAEGRACWEQVRIEPARWRCSPWGDAGGGFWAVAVLGETVLWFNDIEDGFDVSPFAERGVIGEYRCDQLSLDQALWRIAPSR